MAKRREVGPYLDSDASMPFIVTSSIEKVDPATRRLIRSHVMRGKKQKHCRTDKYRRTTSQVPASSRTRGLRVRFEDVSKIYKPTIPSRVGSDLSFIDFAAEIEASMLLNMTKGPSIGSPASQNTATYMLYEQSRDLQQGSCFLWSERLDSRRTIKTGFN